MKVLARYIRARDKRCLQTITRFVTRAAERVSTGAVRRIELRFPLQLFLDVPLRVTYYTRHRSEQHRRYKCEETERKPARCYLALHKPHCRASFPFQTQAIQIPEPPRLIREILISVHALD